MPWASRCSSSTSGWPFASDNTRAIIRRGPVILSPFATHRRSMRVSIRCVVNHLGGAVHPIPSARFRCLETGSARGVEIAEPVARNSPSYPRTALRDVAVVGAVAAAGAFSEGVRPITGRDPRGFRPEGLGFFRGQQRDETRDDFKPVAARMMRNGLPPWIAIQSYIEIKNTFKLYFLQLFTRDPASGAAGCIQIVSATVMP